jgi:signal transduction histidine kinase
MTSDHSVPASCIHDGVAAVDEAGALRASNASMERWVEAYGGALDELPLSLADRAELGDGQPVLLQVDEYAWELRLWEVEGRRWLTARDVSDREQRQATAFASMRSRALGELAASLAHDLNNQFHAALALSGELSFHATDPEDIESIRDLERGTKIGATAIGALSRMLSRMPARREQVAVVDVLEEALAVIRKAYQQAGVELCVVVPEDLPGVRLVGVDVVHALCAVLETVLGMKPSSAALSVTAREEALEEGRLRGYVVARFEFGGLAAQDADAMAAAVVMQRGSLQRFIGNRGLLQGVLAAAFLQRRFGGDLRSEASGDQLVIEFWWPAAR